MTKEEALNKIGELVVYARAQGWDEEFTEAFETLSAECEDCISRKEMLDYQQYLRGKMSNEENHKLWEFIKDLPSVQSKIGHWKYDDDVLGYEGHFGAYTCSCCNKAFLDDLCMNNGSYEINVGNEFKYCPFCGAKLSENPTGSESEG